MNELPTIHTTSKEGICYEEEDALAEASNSCTYLAMRMLIK